MFFFGLDQWKPNCRCESTFKHGILVRYPYDPGQAENQCLQRKHVFHLHSQASNTNTHLSPFSSNVWTFLHLLSSAIPLSLTLSLSHFFLPVSCSLSDAHWLSPPPCPLPSFFVSGSVDQFSVWLIGWSQLWLPRPSHLSLTPTSSPPHLLVSWAYGWLRGLNLRWL